VQILNTIVGKHNNCVITYIIGSIQSRNVNIDTIFLHKTLVVVTLQAAKFDAEFMEANSDQRTFDRSSIN
jgi:CobQ-like glutamine amidotransferase family enzyme